MGGGDWPSSRTESSSSSSRPRIGAGISGCRVTLVGGSPVHKEGSGVEGCRWGLSRGPCPNVCWPPSFWRCFGAHLTGGWGCRGCRLSWPQTGPLTGTSSLTTGTSACCGSGSGLWDREEDRAIVLDFPLPPGPFQVPVGPVTSQEGFLERLQDEGPPEGWGDWPGRTKETNLRPWVLDRERPLAQATGQK